MVVGRDERVATQCAWSHIWKRIMTVLFAVYGIMFAIYKPGLHTQPIPQDTELVWGIVMKEIVPAGLLGLLVASFFAALMSTVDTMATASSAMTVDYLFKKRWFPGRSQQFYLRWARVGGVVAVLLAYLITLQFSTLKEIIEFLAPLQGFLGIPLFFGIAWRGANRRGVWASLMVGVSLLWMVQLFHDGPPSTKVPLSVFPPIGAAALTMYLVSRLTRPESETLLHRFYCILNTPLGRDERLSAVGIRLPAMAGSEGGVKIDERLDEAALGTALSVLCNPKDLWPGEFDRVGQGTGPGVVLPRSSLVYPVLRSHGVPGLGGIGADGFSQLPGGGLDKQDRLVVHPVHPVYPCKTRFEGSNRDGG